MGKLKLYDPSISVGQLAWEREQAYLKLSPLEKWNQLMALIAVSIALNGGKPLKQPQGKGIVISRKKINLHS